MTTTQYMGALVVLEGLVGGVVSDVGGDSIDRGVEE